MKSWCGPKNGSARNFLKRESYQSLIYNSSATRPEIQLGLYRLGENLVDDIIKDSNCNVGTRERCPVFLVGHSLGGIVIKQFILSVIKGRDGLDTSDDIVKKINPFLENFKGVFYYATPHGGSQIADLESRIPRANPILRLLTTLNKERGRINEEFTQHRSRLQAKAYAIAECQPISKFGFSDVVVVEASARLDIEHFYTFPAANHFTVCKAICKDDSAVIGKLTQFITDAIPGYLLQPQLDELVLDSDNIR